MATVNVAALEKHFQDGEEVSPEALRGKGLLRGSYDLLKVLGDGELTKKLKVSAHKFSRQAAEKIEKAGGAGGGLARQEARGEKQNASEEPVMEKGLGIRD